MAKRPTHIRRNMMLKELDIRWMPNGKRYVFSIKFSDKNGYLHFFPFAISRGLTYNVREARQRGIQPCDEKGNPIDHVYPVGIDAFTKYNGMEVIL